MSLKDALLKAGYHSTKVENERQKKLKKEKTKSEKHQEHRNFCEVCETTQPDVERFKHRNPRIDAEWICSNCADKNEILDDFRLTAQSDSARSRRYRRYYGHTRDLSKEDNNLQKDNRPRHKYKHERGREHNMGNRQDNRHEGRGRNQGHNQNRRDGKPKTKYRIDENGEKNFNC